MLTPVATRPAATSAAANWAPRQAPHCSSCAMRHLCMPQGLAPEVLSRLESVICASRPVKRGEALFGRFLQILDHALVARIVGNHDLKIGMGIDHLALFLQRQLPPVVG